LFEFLERSSDLQATTLAVTFWHLWDTRNKLREEGGSLHPSSVVVKVKSYSLSVSVSGGDSGDGHDPDEPGQGGGNLVDDQVNMETENATNLSPAPPQPPAAPAGSYTSLPGAKSVMCDKLGMSVGGSSRFSVPSPARSLPDKLDYGLMDETVWDWEGCLEKPSHIDVDDVEHATLSQLGEKSVNLAYCSQILQSMEDSDNGSVRSEKEEAEDEDLVCLDADVCNKLSGVKKTLLPFLDEASDGMKRMLDNKKKDKWGPVIATRRSSRNHGDVNVMEKAKEYQRRKNLDVPPYFKGNSFAVLQNDSLVSASDAVDIVIGQNDSQQNEIINLLIDKELVLNHDFAIKKTLKRCCHLLMIYVLMLNYLLIVLVLILYMVREVARSVIS
jgi:hypothetical protein